MASVSKGGVAHVELFQRKSTTGSTRNVSQSIIESETNPMAASILKRSQTNTLTSTAFPVQRISRRDGIIADTIGKVDFAKKINVHIRDLRVLDDIGKGTGSGSGSTRVFASVKGLGQAIVFCMENLKVVILRNEALLFSPDTPIAKLFLKTITSEFETYSTLRFEHELLETLFNVAYIWLSMEFVELEEALALARSNQEKESSEIEFVKRQLEMFPRKTQLQLLKKRVIEVVRELGDIQSDDGHMSKLVIEDDSVAQQISKRGTLHDKRAMARRRDTIELDSTDALRTGSVDSDDDSNNKLSVDISVSVAQNVPFASSAMNSHHSSPSPELSNNIRVSPRHGDIPSNHFPSFHIPNDSTSVGRETASGDMLRPSISMRNPSSRLNTNMGNMGNGIPHHNRRRKQSIQFANRPTKDLTFDVELILDNSIIRMCYLENEIDDLIERISAHEAEASLQVDIVRNRIIKYNTFLTMATLAVAVTAVVPGIFGMNLLFPNYLYTTKNPFYFTCMFITLAVPFLFLVLYLIGKRMNCF